MRKTFFLVALLLVLPLLALAQEDDLDLDKQEDIPEEAQAVFRAVFNPVMRAMLEEGADRTGVLIPFLLEAPIFPGLKEELEITDENMKQFRETMQALMKAADLEEQPEVINKLEKGITEDPNYVPSEEDTAELESLFGLVFDHMNEAATATFTEEQMQRLDNAIFGITGGLQSPFLNERHMDTLGMTDEQKAQFNKINEETKPERDKMIASFDAEIQKMVKTGKMSMKDFLSAFSKFRELGTTLKKRRSAVLTSVQLAKVKEMAKLPKSMTLSAFNLFPSWAPDANSWKPGDAVPESFKLPEPGPRRFPKTE